MKLEATSGSFEQKEETIKDSIIHKNEKIFCYKFSRRALDIITASIGILLSFPIIIVFVAIIILETYGNPIFIQERVGLNGKIFYIYKLRSMFVNAEENGAKWAEKIVISANKGYEPPLTLMEYSIVKTVEDYLNLYGEVKDTW